MGCASSKRAEVKQGEVLPEVALGDAPTPRRQRRRLTIHLDLNRTVIMSDTGRETEDMLSYLLAEVCYGKVVAVDGSLLPPAGAGSAGASARWEPGPVGSSPSTSPPPPEHELVTYKAFVDRQYPFLGDTDPVPPGFASVSAANKAAKGERKALQHAFCRRGPGTQYAAALQRLMAGIRLPEGQRAAAREASTQLAPGLLASTWARGDCFLLPSYLRLLLHIQSDPELFGAVRIVYRTFGADAAEVCRHACAGAQSGVCSRPMRWMLARAEHAAGLIAPAVAPRRSPRSWMHSSLAST